MSIADKRRLRVSANGGQLPSWGRDGRELFFVSPRGEIMRAVFSGDPPTITAAPEVLFRPCTSLNLGFGLVASEAFFDVTPDGSRFLARCDPLDAVPSDITVVLNWQARLR